MPPFQSINLAAPAEVIEVAGKAFRLGALPSQSRPLLAGEEILNDRVKLEPGSRLVLQVRGGERLVVEVGPGGAKTYFFHVVDEKQVRSKIDM